MKLLIPVLPVLVCFSLLGSLAIFIAGTFIFLAMQAFYELHEHNGALVAYLGITAGVLVFSCICYKLIKCGFSCYANKKDKVAKSGIEALIPTAKLLAGYLLIEGVKWYLGRNKESKK